MPNFPRVKTQYTAPLSAFGVDTQRINNIYFVGPGKIVYSAANFVFFHELGGGNRRVIACDRGYEVTSIALHPECKILAVSERDEETVVTLRDVEGMKIQHELRIPLGSHCTDMSFSPEGNLLATLSSGPDFSLIIWDWRSETILLRTKAFSQATWRVEFSRFFDRHLSTCGMGHIKFWSMAATFTGLKLKGDVGKFGQFEISDTYSVAELPTGHSATGTQSGQLILWDGGLISGVVRGPGGKEAHSAFITTTQLYLNDTFRPSASYGAKLSDAERFDDPVALLRQLPPEFSGLPSKYPCILTAGMDGFIRLWPVGPIMGSLFSTNKGDEESSMFLVVEPLAEINIGIPIIDVRISQFTEKGKESWILQTAQGLFLFDAVSRQTRCIAPGHSPPMVSALNKDDGLLLVGCAAGFLSLHDPNATNGPIAVRPAAAYQTSVTCITALDGCAYASFCVGYQDGSVRFFDTTAPGKSKSQQGISTTSEASTPNLRLVCSCKPHRTPVTQLCFDASQSILLSIDTSLVVFVFYLHAPVSVLPSHAAPASTSMSPVPTPSHQPSGESQGKEMQSMDNVSPSITPAVFIDMLSLLKKVKPRFQSEMVSPIQAVFEGGVLTLFCNSPSATPALRYLSLFIPSLDEILSNTSNRSDAERACDPEADSLDYTRFVTSIPTAAALNIPRLSLSPAVEDVLIAKAAMDSASNDDMTADGPPGSTGGGSKEMDPVLVDMSVDLASMTSQDREALLRKHSDLEAKQDNPKLEPDTPLLFRIVASKKITIQGLRPVLCALVYVLQSEVPINGVPVEWEQAASVQECISTSAKYLLQYRLRARSTQLYIFDVPSVPPTDTLPSSANSPIPTEPSSPTSHTGSSAITAVKPFDAISLLPWAEDDVATIVSSLDSTDTFTNFDVSIPQQGGTSSVYVVLVDTHGRLVVREAGELPNIVETRTQIDLAAPGHKPRPAAQPLSILALCGPPTNSSFQPSCHVVGDSVLVVSPKGLVFNLSLPSLVHPPASLPTLERPLPLTFTPIASNQDAVPDIPQGYAVLEDIRSELKQRRELDQKFTVKNRLLAEIHEIRRQYKELIEDVAAVSPNIQPEASLCYIDKMLDSLFSAEFPLTDASLVDKTALPHLPVSALALRNLSHIPKYFATFHRTYMGHRTPTLFVSSFRRPARGVRTLLQYDLPADILLTMKERIACSCSRQQSRNAARGEGAAEEPSPQTSPRALTTPGAPPSTRGSRASSTRTMRDHAKVQERQRKRDERMAELAELKRLKTTLKEIRPEDKARIEEAERTPGAWQLKLSGATGRSVTVRTNHSIPDKLQEFINQSYLAHRMVLLFNTRVLRLLRLKGCVVVATKLYEKLLVDVEAELVESAGREVLWALKGIYGDPREVVDPVQLSEDESRALFSRKGEAWKELGELLSFSYATECPKPSVSTDAVAKSQLLADLVSTINPRGKGGRGTDGRQGNRPLTTKDRGVDYRRSAMIHLREAWLRIRDQIAALVDTFDAAVEDLTTTYYDVKADQQRASAASVSLFSEISIQQIFKQRESDIIRQLAAVYAEREALRDEFIALGPAIASQAKKLSDFSTQAAALFQEVDALIPETSQFKGLLLKAFNAKRKVKEAREGPRDYENSASDETDWDDISSDDELDTLPPGLAPELYQNVLDTRARRYAIEDKVTAERQQADALAARHAQLAKQQERLEAVKAGLQGELNQIHQNKMDMINAVATISPFALSQIMVSGDPPYTLDYSNKVIFSLDAFKGLHGTAYDHVMGRRALIQELKRRDAMKGEQAAEERQQQRVLEEMEEKLRSVQLLKFGREVKLEDIDSISVNTKAEELMGRIEDEERVFRRQEEEWMGQIRFENEKLRATIESNTGVIGSLYDLTKSQYDIEGAIKQQERNSKAVNSLNMSENIKRVEVEMLQKHVESQNEVISELLAKIAQLRSGKVI